MRYLITFSLILLFSSVSLAEDHFRDVPEGHWATEAVYELMKTGVTAGYPDGTFRGKKEISRYEMASFLSKLSRSFNLRQGIDEKLIEELKAEVALIKYQEEKAAKETRFTGEIESRARVSSMAPRGGKMDYRLKLNLVRNFGEDSILKIGLDTVDAGFNSSNLRDLTTRLIDIESRFKLAGLDFKVNLGPGVVPHSDDLFPSENNTIYIRPKAAVEASGKTGGMSYSAAYVTRQMATSGLIGVHELTGKLGYDFGNLAVHLRPRYLFKINGPRDLLAEAGIDLYPDKNWETSLLLSVGSFQDGEKGAYAEFIGKIKDPWKTGTNITLRADKVGSKYRIDDLDEYEFVYLNNFDRLILDGTVDIGLKFEQRLSDKLSLEWKGDYVADGELNFGENYPGTYSLWQLGLGYALFSNAGLNAFYRSYNVPSGTAQFSDPVPAVSEIIGVSLKCSF
jgi:hypothetical protein